MNIHPLPIVDRAQTLLDYDFRRHEAVVILQWEFNVTAEIADKAISAAQNLFTEGEIA